MSLEKRVNPRFTITLAARIVAIDNQPVSWEGETKDIGAGGVRFILPRELPIGNTVDYIITLSDNKPPARIYCVGKVLRCVKKENSWEAAATMVRYVFLTPEGPDHARAASQSGPANSDPGTLPLETVDPKIPALVR